MPCPHVLASNKCNLVGDFNFHAELIIGSKIQLVSDLEMLGLFQKVTGPAHIVGHALDIIFTNALDLLVNPPFP